MPRPTFGTVSSTDMDQDLIIWRSCSALVASLGNIQAGLLRDGKELIPKSSLGDYNILVSKSSIVGFSFAVTKRDIALMKPLFAAAENVRVQPIKNELVILLGQAEDAEIETEYIQASSTVLWFSGEPVCIALTPWIPWREFGFKLSPLPFYKAPQ